MARVVISIEPGKNGLSVDCKVIPDAGDTDLSSTVAAAVAVGLAGHVNTKIHAALTKTREAKKNVH